MLLHITLIHNNELERLAYIRPLLKRVAETYTVNYTEINHQTLKYVSLPNVLIRKIYFIYTGHKWRKFLNGEKFKIFFDSVYELLFDTLKLLNKNFRISVRKKISIEDALSRKHFKALKDFSILGKSDDILICFESDAIIASIDYFFESLNYLIRTVDVNNFYLFAFPFSEKDICLNDAEWKEAHREKLSSEYNTDADVIYFPKLFTNTACAYAMTHELACQLVANSKNKFRRIYLPADFHQNLVFLKLAKKSLSLFAKTVIFMPPPIVNGSLKSYYNSELSSIDEN